MSYFDLQITIVNFFLQRRLSLEVFHVPTDLNISPLLIRKRRDDKMNSIMLDLDRLGVSSFLDNKSEFITTIIGIWNTGCSKNFPEFEMNIKIAN